MASMASARTEPSTRSSPARPEASVRCPPLRTSTLSVIRTSAFVQDHWTPTPQITVDAGVRFDASAFPSSLGMTNRQLSPRAGVAWMPAAKWVIRGGAGLFADRLVLAAVERGWLAQKRSGRGTCRRPRRPFGVHRATRGMEPVQPSNEHRGGARTDVESHRVAQLPVRSRTPSSADRQRESATTNDPDSRERGFARCRRARPATTRPAGVRSRPSRSRVGRYFRASADVRHRRTTASRWR